MIFCITLFQRAASRVKKRQSGAEDPRLRAACVNRGFVPPSSTVPSSPRYRAAWSVYHAWESGCFNTASEVVPRSNAPSLAGGSRSLRLRSVAGTRSCAEDEGFLRSGEALCRTAAYRSEPVAE